jgi:lipid-binding SYLF domain-containing protein
MACAALVGAVLVGAAGLARAQSEEAAVVRDASAVFAEIVSAPDRSIPKAILDRAQAIAVFPSLMRAAFIVGGQHGHGIISARDPKTGTWSAPAFVTITGGSFGAQVGGEAIDLVLVILNERGFNNLLRNEFKIGGEASAAAGPVGRSAEAATDVQLRAQILSYSRSRGLFAGLAVNGSSIHADENANQRMYGQPYSTRDIVVDGKGGSPEAIGLWKDTLGKYLR